MGYFFGGQSTIDGTSSDDRQSDLGWALSMGIPITRNFGLKLTYIGIRTLTNTCLLYTSPSPRDRQKSRMPSSA